MSYDLQSMIDMLRSPWREEVDWAMRITDCSDACHAHKATLPLVELRHFECACPSRLEYRRTAVTRLPVLTQVLEAKWAAPVTGQQGRNPNKAASGVPGNLLAPDAVLRQIDVALARILADWGVTVASLASPTDLMMEEIHRSIATLLAVEGGAEALDDAAAHLAGPFGAAMRFLGYSAGRALLEDTSCGGCGGALAVSKDFMADPYVRCAGSGSEPPCGVSYGPEDMLALLCTVPDYDRCVHGHVYDGRNTRVASDGRRHCRSCDKARKRRKREEALNEQNG